MANALGSLFSDIANAIRGKTGDTGTMKPAEFPAAIERIVVGGGSSDGIEINPDDLTEVFPITEITVPDNTDGMVPIMQPLGTEVGSIYLIVWDNVGYICKAQAAEFQGVPVIAIGNLAALGGENTGEPFAIGEFPPEVAAQMGGTYGGIIPLDGSTSFSAGGYFIAKTVVGGGESSDLVKYVTFMNGNVELYRMPVLVGDDCKDPQVRGDILTPTKESTPQYSYTYYGWGASDGGSADSNILKNITEDKTVYAIYSAATRRYTVTFFDSDGTTILKTVSVVYGNKPSYTPVKEGFDFLRWTPDLAVVTGEASYTAVWEERTIFAAGQEITNTWDEIFSYTDRGLHTVKYLPGSYKYIEYENGSRDRFDVAATDTDEKADGTGKAPITWIINNAPLALSTYNDQLAVLVTAAVKTFTRTNDTWKADGYKYPATGKWIISMPSGGTLNIAVSFKGNGKGSSSLYTSKGTVDIDGVSKFNKSGVASNDSFTVDCGVGETTEITASFNRAVLGDAGDYLRITFSSESEFAYDYILQPSPAVYQNGTGTQGSWKHSKLRTNAKSRLSTIPENIRNRIVDVYKVSQSRDGGVNGSVTTIDDIWVPSQREVADITIANRTYAALFPDDNSRKKSHKWMLRDVTIENYVNIIDTSGSSTLDSPTTLCAYLYGFCTG